MFKKSILALSFIVLSVPVTYANDNHTFKFGTEISNIKYEEPSVDMEEEGIFYGLENLMLKTGGYDFYYQDIRFTPYFCIGYRYLNDDLSEVIGGYIPLGLETNYKINSK